MLRTLTILLLAGRPLGACATEQAACAAAPSGGPVLAPTRPGRHARSRRLAPTASSWPARPRATQGHLARRRRLPRPRRRGRRASRPTCEPTPSRAALQAGDVAAAAALAPPRRTAPAAAALGLLVPRRRGDGRGQGQGRLRPPHQPRHRLSARRPPALLLAPFAAAAAGDATRTRWPGRRWTRDRRSRSSSPTSTSAALQERLASLRRRRGRLQGADAVAATRAASSPMPTARFLERRGRWADAAALYKDRLAHEPRRRRRRGGARPGREARPRAAAAGRSARARPSRC